MALINLKYIKVMLLALLSIFMISCHNNVDNGEKSVKASALQGTWKLVYAETQERDSIKIKDLKNSDFIKIINKTHFAFLNQDLKNSTLFYGGGGTYTLKGNQYIEVLVYTALDSYRNKTFPFTFEIKGDSLIQYGVEEIKEHNIKKHIIEKYIKIK